jgi:hypothetical protein
MIPVAATFGESRAASASGVGKSLFSPATGVSMSSPNASAEARGDARGRDDGNLLAEDRAHRELEAVGGAGQPQAGTRRCQLTQRLRDFFRVRGDVEQMLHA